MWKNQKQQTDKMTPRWCHCPVISWSFQRRCPPFVRVGHSHVYSTCKATIHAATGHRWLTYSTQTKTGHLSIPIPSLGDRSSHWRSHVDTRVTLWKAGWGGAGRGGYAVAYGLFPTPRRHSLTWYYYTRFHVKLNSSRRSSLFFSEFGILSRVRFHNLSLVQLLLQHESKRQHMGGGGGGTCLRCGVERVCAFQSS